MDDHIARPRPENNPQKIISRAEAKARGLKFYFTGEPCKHGHVAERNVDRRECTECRQPTGGSYYERNKERVLARGTAYRAAHREERKAKYRALHPKKPKQTKEESLAKARAWSKQDHV